MAKEKKVNLFNRLKNFVTQYSEASEAEKMTIIDDNIREFFYLYEKGFLNYEISKEDLFKELSDNLNMCFDSFDKGFLHIVKNHFYEESGFNKNFKVDEFLKDTLKKPDSIITYGQDVLSKFQEGLMIFAKPENKYKLDMKTRTRKDVHSVLIIMGVSGEVITMYPLDENEYIKKTKDLVIKENIYPTQYLKLYDQNINKKLSKDKEEVIDKRFDFQKFVAQQNTTKFEKLCEMFKHSYKYTEDEVLNFISENGQNNFLSKDSSCCAGSVYKNLNDTLNFSDKEVDVIRKKLETSVFCNDKQNKKNTKSKKPKYCASKSLKELEIGNDGFSFRVKEKEEVLFEGVDDVVTLEVPTGETVICSEEQREMRHITTFYL